MGLFRHKVKHRKTIGGYVLDRIAEGGRRKHEERNGLFGLLGFLR